MKPEVKILSRHISMFEYVCVQYNLVVKVGLGSLFFTPQGEKPFGSWRESHELGTNAKIATRQLLSSSPRPCCNCSVFSLVFFSLSPCCEFLKLSDSYLCINKPLQLFKADESSGLGSLDPDSIKNHPRFDAVDYRGLEIEAFLFLLK
ncbi:hypothetical protein NC652_023466 [Populus alba x Populus x berolinensis]|nr:hypothetical protein NC652_023466 [Populus alba x Populus x berolinensis]